ncbi:docking protein 1-like isoform X1 [Scyliorhinus canicula]|uniref:docking protein 1-like isoform X1 n=2 Tax=Scyliorhinus canicula TaxID=7830 RepID=UPI0018F5DB0E|nr:docking protein 1-like isoform X1 [Scyliorhinus canicula]
MEDTVKEGLLYMQQQKFRKKWKRVWLILYSQSIHSVARLEYFEFKEGSILSERQMTRKIDRKLIRMSDCVRISEVVADNCSKDSSAFSVETTSKLYTFLTERTDCNDWVQKLTETAFQHPQEDSDAMAMRMKENELYCSHEGVNEYKVLIRRTDASERCELSGMYLLKAGEDALILKNIITEQIVYEWPYMYLRRFGGDKRMFSIESGRRCKSGPGRFEFETKQGKQIFLSVNAAVKMQKDDNEEERCNSDPLESYSLFSENSVTCKQYSGSTRSHKEHTAEHKAQLAKRVSSLISDVSEGMHHLCYDAPPDHQASTPLSKSPVRFQYSFPSSPLFASHDKVNSKLSAGTAENWTTPYSETSPGGGHLTLPLEPPNSTKSIPRQQSSITARGEDTLPHKINESFFRFPSKIGSFNNEHNSVKKSIPSIIMTQHPESLYDTVYSGSNKPECTNVFNQTTNHKKNEHIYEISDDSLLYDEAKELSEAWKVQGRLNDSLGYEYPYNPSADDYAVPKQTSKGAPPRPPKKVPSPRESMQKSDYANVESIIRKRHSCN